MLLWSFEHRVFAYDTYVKNGESVTETQCLFKRRFNIGRHGNVPSRNSILRRVNALRTTGSLLKTKPPGLARTARTPRNVNRVREAITRSPRCSARRHSAELGISQSTVQRIFHKDLPFQPYKVMTVQQFPRDYQQRLFFCQTMFDIVMQEASDAHSKTADSDTVSTYQVSSVQLVTDKKLEAFNKA